MGLFDFESPEAVKRTIKQEGIAQDMSRGGMTGWQAIGAAAYGGGRKMGQALGGTDPRVEKAQKMQQAQQMVMQSGLTPDQPEFYDAAADALMQMGLQQEAFNAKMQGQKFKQDQETRGVDLDYKRALTSSALNKDTRGPTRKKYDDLVDIFGEDRAKEIMSSTRGRAPIMKETSQGWAIYNESTRRFELVKDASGKPVTSGAQNRADMRLDEHKTREGRLERQLSHRKDKHIDRLYGQYADDYRADVKPLKAMSEEVEGALRTLNKENFTSADSKLLQRQLAAVRKANTKAQSEIDSWAPGETGDILQRIEGSLSGFFAGEYSDTEIALARDSLNDLMRNYINPAYQRYDDHYRVKTGRRGMNPDEVIRPRFTNEKKVPKAGDIEDGHKFLGGDPADPKNWEKQ